MISQKCLKKIQKYAFMQHQQQNLKNQNYQISMSKLTKNYPDNLCVKFTENLKQNKNCLHLRT